MSYHSLRTEETGATVLYLDGVPRYESSPQKSTCFQRMSANVEKLVMLPDDTKWLSIWDVSTVILLFVTAYYEPYSIAVLHHDPPWAHILNHVLDLTFSIDMLLQFFIAYGEPVESTAQTSLWVKDLFQIARRYCSIPLSHGGKAGWFWIDLMTVLPGWLGMLRIVKKHRDLSILRIIRLVRLCQLVRLESIVRSWHQKFGFSYYLAELGKFAVITTLTIHWMACVWIIVEGRISNGKLSYRTDRETWLTALINTKGDCCTPSAAKDPTCVYFIAVYWATMTLTTVGYGDIVAQNPMEYMVCTLCMLVVAYVWAYIVGKIVTILETLDPHEKNFRQQIDDLQDLMDKRRLPADLQVRLRRYMHEAKTASLQRLQQKQLGKSISESLQREVTMHSSLLETFTAGVYWSRDIQQDALLDLLRCLSPVSFGPNEIMTQPHALFIMRRGLAAVKGNILKRGDIWGVNDILLCTDALIETAFPRTLSYVDILTLHRSSLVEVCRVFPHADKRIRRAQIRTACFRAFIMTARLRVLALPLRKAATKTVQRKSVRQNPTSAVSSFANPGQNNLHVSSWSPPKDETKLSDLKFLLEKLEKRQVKLEDMANSILRQLTV